MSPRCRNVESVPSWVVVFMPTLSFFLTLPAVTVLVSQLWPTPVVLHACFELRRGS